MAVTALEYYCDKSRAEVRVTLSMSVHDKAKVACPQCGSRGLHSLESAVCPGSSNRTAPLAEGSAGYAHGPAGGPCRGWP